MAVHLAGLGQHCHDWRVRWDQVRRHPHGQMRPSCLRRHLYADGRISRRAGADGVIAGGLPCRHRRRHVRGERVELGFEILFGCVLAAPSDPGTRCCARSGIGAAPTLVGLPSVFDAEADDLKEAVDKVDELAEARPSNGHRWCAVARRSRGGRTRSTDSASCNQRKPCGTGKLARRETAEDTFEVKYPGTVTLQGR